MTNALGLLRFRAPLDKDDRAKVLNPSVTSGNGTALPIDSITLTGGWPSPLVSPPQLRPIFPGAMRFVARDPLQAPSLDQVEANTSNGIVNSAYLNTLQLVGTIVVRLQSQPHTKDMERAGTIGAIGESPRIAIYGPVKLSERFLREAILDGSAGLKAGSFYKNLVKVKPGDTDWQPLALYYFLRGTYEPILRAQAALDKDDAQRLPMPELITEQLPATGFTFNLNITLGWLRDPAHKPIAPTDPQLETIPVTTFLRHIGKEGIREEIDFDASLVALFQNETSSRPWEDRLNALLHGIGFGASDGSLPLDQTLREFQISAAADVIATPVVLATPLDGWKFGDLIAVANPDRYLGAISGRANSKTRSLVALWHGEGFRSPLFIVAYNSNDLGPNQRPPVGAIPVRNDIWSRYETKDESLRMFAADFTRLAPGMTMTQAQLEPIGSYVKNSPSVTIGGPRTGRPSAVNRVEFAEVTPERLLSIPQADLILATLPGANDPMRSIASTFKVIRAVAEIECRGYLDQINAYDNAGLSYGPCHWAMAGAIKKPTGATELGALAAYLRYLDLAGVVSGADIFKPQGLAANLVDETSFAKVAAASAAGRHLAQLCYLDDRGKPRPIKNGGDVEFQIPSWRSFYRWVRLGREHLRIGEATWRMAVRRLHSLSRVPIVLVTGITGQPEQRITLGEVFHSELAMAQLMRWHVKIPGAVVVGSGQSEKASGYITDAYKAAANEASQLSSDDFAQSLVKALRVQLDKFVADTGTAHDELPGNFDEIAGPTWIEGDTSNPYAFGLDPRLRTLASSARSFHLAPLRDERERRLGTLQNFD